VHAVYTAGPSGERCGVGPLSVDVCDGESDVGPKKKSDLNQSPDNFKFEYSLKIHGVFFGNNANLAYEKFIIKITKTIDTKNQIPDCLDEPS
jgi:hypothetical protein